MKKGIGTIVVLLLFSCAAVAQNGPKYEVFAGYQYMRLNPSVLPSGINANGWNAAFTGNANRWLGLTADFSGIYKTVNGIDVKGHTYTFGPVFSVRKGDETFVPYVHTLFGGFHGSAGFAGGSASTNGFAMMMGGGLDAKLSQHVYLRVAQVDWSLLRYEGITDKKNVRVGTGLVVRF